MAFKVILNPCPITADAGRPENSCRFCKRSGFADSVYDPEHRLCFACLAEGVLELLQWGADADLPPYAVPQDIAQLQSKRSLHLVEGEASYTLTNIQPLSHWHWLQELWISQQPQLTELQSGLEGLALQRLSLTALQLSELPDAVRQMSGLSYLNLMNNALTELPDWLWQLPQLTQLNLGFNQLASLPETIVNAQQLKTLYLWHNPTLKQLPPQLAELPNLEEVWLNGTAISCIPEVFNHSQIRFIFAEEQVA